LLFVNSLGLAGVVDARDDLLSGDGDHFELVEVSGFELDLTGPNKIAVDLEGGGLGVGTQGELRLEGVEGAAHLVGLGEGTEEGGRVEGSVLDADGLELGR